MSLGSDENPDREKAKTLAGKPKHILRIIQYIPSKKTEPFKRWLAQVGAERIDETIDPERADTLAVV